MILGLLMLNEMSLVYFDQFVDCREDDKQCVTYAPCQDLSDFVCGKWQRFL